MNSLDVLIFVACIVVIIITLVCSYKIESYLNNDRTNKRLPAMGLFIFIISPLGLFSTAFCGWYAGKWIYPVRLQTQIALDWKRLDNNHLFGFNYVGDHANWTSPIFLKLRGPTYVQSKCILFLYKSEKPFHFRYYIRRSDVDRYDSSIVIPVEKYAKGDAAIEVDTLDDVRADLGERLKALGVTIPDPVYDEVFDSIALLHRGKFRWNKWKIGSAVDSTQWVRIEKEYFVRSGGMGFMFMHLNDKYYINDEAQGSFKRGITGIIASIIIYMFLHWLAGKISVHSALSPSTANSLCDHASPSVKDGHSDSAPSRRE